MDKLNSLLMSGVVVCGALGYGLSHYQAKHEPIPEITIKSLHQKVTHDGKLFELLDVNGRTVAREVTE